MSSFRVVVADSLVPDLDIDPQVMQAAGGEVEIASGDAAVVVAAARSGDALLNCYFPLSGVVIEQLSRCRIVARYGIGSTTSISSPLAVRGSPLQTFLLRP